jgi:hypothetical protein
MESQKKFNIYMGLLKSDMKTDLNKDSVIKAFSDGFKSLGIMGFNVENINGVWNGESENALKFSFINTFGVYTKDILKMLDSLKVQFEQESILIEEEKVLYNFV